MANPKYQAIEYQPDGSFISYPIIAVGLTGESWKDESDRPGKIKFKFRPIGSFRGIVKYWNKDDFLETLGQDGRKLIELGIQYKDPRTSAMIKSYRRQINHLTTENAFNKSEAGTTRANLEEEKEKALKLAKSMIAFAPIKKGEKK